MNGLAFLEVHSNNCVENGWGKESHSKAESASRERYCL